jgi:hypothetical protein
MTPIKLLSAGLIAATMLATPAMARGNLAKRHVSERANAIASLTSRYTDRHARIVAPRVRALPAAPEYGPGGICDFGDNPMIC